jgi:hypothetical protein
MPSPEPPYRADSSIVPFSDMAPDFGLYPIPEFNQGSRPLTGAAPGTSPLPPPMAIFTYSVQQLASCHPRPDRQLAAARSTFSTDRQPRCCALASTHDRQPSAVRSVDRQPQCCALFLLQTASHRCALNFVHRPPATLLCAISFLRPPASCCALIYVRRPPATVPCARISPRPPA